MDGSFDGVVPVQGWDPFYSRLGVGVGGAARCAGDGVGPGVLERRGGFAPVNSADAAANTFRRFPDCRGRFFRIASNIGSPVAVWFLVLLVVAVHQGGRLCFVVLDDNVLGTIDRGVGEGHQLVQNSEFKF